MKLRSSSIATVVILVLVGVVTAMFGAIGLLDYRGHRDDGWERLRRGHQTLADQLALGLASPLWNFDHATLEKIAEGALQDEAVSWIVIRLADDGSIIHARARDQRWEQTVISRQPEPAGDELVAQRTIRFENQAIGTLQVAITTRFLEHDLLVTRRVALAAGAALDLVLVLVLALLLWRIVLRPLQRIERFAVAVSSGDRRSGGADSGLSGEIASLHASITSMVAQLDARFAEARAHQQQLQSLLDVAPLPISWAEADGRIGYWNRKALDLFGYPPGEIATIAAWALRAYPDPAYRAQAMARWDALVAAAKRDGGEIRGGEYRITCQDGTERTVEIVGAFFAEKLLVVFHDISERKRAEVLMRESERRYREVWENASDCLFMLSVEGGGRFRVMGLNPSHERATGMSDAAVAGKLVEETAAPEMVAAVLRHYHDCLAARAPITYEEELSMPSGRMTFLTTLVPIVDQSGAVARILGVSRDLTAFTRAERAALDAERDAIVGRMAGRVAHEVNNPLEAIKVYIEPLRARVRDRPEVLDGLAIIDQQVDRIARLVRTLLNFVRQRSLHRQSVRLAEVLGTVAELFRPRFEKQAKRLEADLPADLASGAVDVDEVQQVLINLLENALDAVPHGNGRVTLDARCADGWLTVRIADNGPGLGADPEHLFKPFVTTKAKGTGLGLAVARRICEAHGGKLTGSNGAAGGACFEMLLRIDAPADAGALPGGEILV